MYIFGLGGVVTQSGKNDAAQGTPTQPRRVLTTTHHTTTDTTRNPTCEGRCRSQPFKPWPLSSRAFIPAVLTRGPYHSFAAFSQQAAIFITVFGRGGGEATDKYTCTCIIVSLSRGGANNTASSRTLITEHHYVIASRDWCWLSWATSFA